MPCFIRSSKSGIPHCRMRQRQLNPRTHKRGRTHVEVTKAPKDAFIKADGDGIVFSSLSSSADTPGVASSATSATDTARVASSNTARVSARHASGVLLLRLLPLRARGRVRVAGLCVRAEPESTVVRVRIVAMT